MRIPVIAAVTLCALAICAAPVSEAKVLLGSQVRISEEGSASASLGADVAYDERSDRYLAVWAGLGQGVSARILDGTGNPIGAAFRVSEGSGPVEVVGGPPSEFFVMWRECPPGALEGCKLIAQRLRPTGERVAAPFLVAENTRHGGTAVYNAAQREYLVAWANDEIRAQRLRGDGARIGEPGFRVSATGAVGAPVLAHGPARNEYLIAWDRQAGSYFDDVRAQRLDRAGRQIGPDDFAIPDIPGATGADGASSLKRVFAVELAHDPVRDRYLLFRQTVASGHSVITSRWIEGSGALAEGGPAAFPRESGSSHFLGFPSASFDTAESRFYWVWTEDLDPALDLDTEIFASPVDGDDRVSDFGRDNTPYPSPRRNAGSGTIVYNPKADQHMVVFIGEWDFNVFARRIGNPPDRRPPVVSIRTRKRQRVVRRRGVIVRLRCDEPCSFTATARIVRPRASRSPGVARARGSLAANKRTRVRLKLSRSKVRSLRRVLGRRKSVRVRITVIAKDRAGNTSTAKRSIRGTR